MNDVAVIGGGIAGAVAALRLAQRGAAPLWITPPTLRGFKPGEHLGAAAIPMLRDLGSDALLRAEVHRHAHGTYSAWGSDLLSERNSIVQLEGAPIVLDRAAFEAALTQQAVAAGAHQTEGVVRNITIRDKIWDLNLGNDTLRAPFVIDATGRKAVIAARFTTRFQADRLMCQYAIYDCPKGTQPRPVTLIEAARNGWWYLSVLADNRAVVNFYTDADAPGIDTASLDQIVQSTGAISAFLSDHGYAIASQPKRIATNSTWLAPAIGPGWVAIGDAAAAFDPLSSHGMTTAIWTAIQAADAFVARDRDAMQTYAQAVANGVQDYLAARTRVYTQEQRWPDAPFWKKRTKPIPVFSTDVPNTPEFVQNTFARSAP